MIQVDVWHDSCRRCIVNTGGRDRNSVGNTCYTIYEKGLWVEIHLHLSTLSTPACSRGRDRCLMKSVKSHRVSFTPPNQFKRCLQDRNECSCSRNLKFRVSLTGWSAATENFKCLISVFWPPTSAITRRAVSSSFFTVLFNSRAVEIMTVAAHGALSAR